MRRVWRGEIHCSDGAQPCRRQASLPDAVFSTDDRKVGLIRRDLRSPVHAGGDTHGSETPRTQAPGRPPDGKKPIGSLPATVSARDCGRPSLMSEALTREGVDAIGTMPATTMANHEHAALRSRR